MVKHLRNHGRTVKEIVTSGNARLPKNNRSYMGPEGQIMEVEIAPIIILDGIYQRQASESHYAKIAAEYKYMNAKVPTLFRDSDGYFYAPDGQHTLCAQYMRDMKTTVAMVFDLPKGSTIDHMIKIQSSTFVAVNKNARKISKYDEWRNDCIQGDPVALGIKALCEKYGIKPIPSDTKKNYRRPLTITHMHNLKVAYTQIGSDSLEQAMQFIVKFWPDEPVSGTVILFLSRFFKIYYKAKLAGRRGSDYDEQALFNALTDNGTKYQDQIEDVLDEFTIDVSMKEANKADIWRHKAAVRAYNYYASTKNIPTLAEFI